MKKFILTLVLALTPMLFFGQSVFDKFDGQDDVTAVVVTKKMFQMMGNVKDQNSQEFMKMVKKLNNLKVYTTESVAMGKEMKATADGYIRSAGLEELMRINDGGQNIRIMVKTGATESQVKEMLMFIDGVSGKKESVLMTLTGEFDLNDVSTLTEKMNLPGGDNLKKASQQGNKKSKK